MIPTCRLLAFVLLRKFEGFAVASSIEGSAFIISPLSYFHLSVEEEEMRISYFTLFVCVSRYASVPCCSEVPRC